MTKTIFLFLVVFSTGFLFHSCKEDDVPLEPIESPDLLKTFKKDYQNELQQYRESWVRQQSAEDSAIRSKLDTAVLQSLRTSTDIILDKYIKDFISGDQNEFLFFIGEPDDSLYGKFIQDTEAYWAEFREDYRTSENRDSTKRIFINDSFDSFNENVTDPTVEHIHNSFKK